MPPGERRALANGGDAEDGTRKGDYHFKQAEAVYKKAKKEGGHPGTSIAPYY